jgi:DNA-binding CsgD family transcriptional regulator
VDHGVVMSEHTSDCHLTQRETECLQWLARGLRQDALADQLNISRTTVEMHIVNARKKLGAQTTTHAVAIALARGKIGM